MIVRNQQYRGFRVPRSHLVIGPLPTAVQWYHRGRKMNDHGHKLDFLPTPGDPRGHYRCSRCHHLGVVRPGGDPDGHFRRVGPCPGKPRAPQPWIDKTQAITNTIEGGLAGMAHGDFYFPTVDEATFRNRVAVCGKCPRSVVRLHTLTCGVCHKTLRTNPMLAALAWHSDISCKDPEGDRWTNLEN